MAHKSSLDEYPCVNQPLASAYTIAAASSQEWETEGLSLEKAAIREGKQNLCQDLFEIISKSCNCILVL